MPIIPPEELPGPPPEKKPGVFHADGKKVDVSDVPTSTLADIEKKVREDGIELNVKYDPDTGKATATPDVFTVVTDADSLPTEEPL